MQMNIIVTFLFCSLASANLGEKAHQVNEASQTLSPNPYCPSCGSEPNSDARGPCLRSLCPEDFRSNLIGSVAQQEDLDARFTKELEPILSTYFSLHIANEKNKLSDALEFVRSPSILTDQGSIKLVNMFAMLNLVELINRVNPSGTPQEVRSRIEAAVPGVPWSRISEALELQRFLGQLWTERPFQNTDPAKIRVAYTRVEFEKYLEQIFLAYSERISVIRNSPNFNRFEDFDALTEMYDIEGLRAQFRTSELSTAAMDRFNRVFVIARLFLNSDKNDVLSRMLTQDSLDLRAWTATLNSKARLEEALQKLKRNEQKPIGDLGFMCKFAFQNGQRLLPTQAEIDQHKANRLPIIKKRFKDKVLAKLSPESRSVLEPVVNRWEPEYPTTKQDHLANMKAHFQKLIDLEHKVREVRNTRRTSADPTGRNAYNALIAVMNISDGKLEAQELCLKLVPQELNDASWDNRFLVGPLVMKTPAAEGVTAHEMGHLLYHNLNKLKMSSETSQWFQSTKRCLVEGSKDEKYLSEDWADFVSALYDGSDNRSLCALGPVPWDEVTLKNSNPADSHASDFYRILNSHVMRTGGVPEICRKALLQRNETPTMRNCVATP